MKNNKILHFLLVASILWALLPACRKDNFAGPDAQLYGEILDAATGEAVGQDIYNGSMIRYIERGYENPPVQEAYFKTDGTFRNNLMFSGTYDFFLNQGNFVPDTLRGVVLKKGENHLTFNVTQYILVYDVLIEQTGENTVTARFKLKQNTKDKVQKIGLFVHRESAVGNGTKYDSTERMISGNVPSGYEMSLTWEYTGNVRGITKGKPYYFRVGALSNAPAAKYNYAPAVRLVLE